MLDILKNYLDGAATPELTSSIEDAHKVLDRIGKQGYEEGFAELLMTDDIVDLGTTVESIASLTKLLEHQILEAHGVFVHEDTQLEILTIFINGILDIQHYDDKDLIMRMTNLESNSEEIFAEILAIVTSKNAEELLPYIDTVARSTIDQIRALVIEESGGDISEEQRMQNSKYVVELKRFFAFIGNNQLSIVELMQNGLPVGFPFLIYVNMIGRTLEEMKPDLAARELISMAIISSDGHDNPQSIILDNLETFVSSAVHSTNIMNYVSDYQIRFLNGSKTNA